MADENPSSNELFRSALQRTADCPPLELLDRLVESADAKLVAHVRGCAFCSAELRMLEAFQADVPAQDVAAVEEITRRLDRAARFSAHSPELPRGEAPGKSWWRFRVVWYQPALLAAAALVVIGVGLQLLRPGPPALRNSGAAESGAYRSPALTILSPSGDLPAPPEELRWQAVPSATAYQARLLEVDGSELWSVRTANTVVSLPPSVRAQILPAKTLLLDVAAFDAAGKRIAESETTRFRLLQNLYRR